MNNTDLELEIRRGFSEVTPGLQRLSLWASNILSELTAHDELIYHFSVRIKNIKSLLAKVTKLINEGVSINNYKDVEIYVNDLIAARIIVYIPSELLILHSLLVSCRRVDIKRVIIHCHEDQNKKLIKQIEQISFLQPIIEHNQTGYFGIHYLFEPKSNTEFYTQPLKNQHSIMELQVRTLMNHAWSEMQHRVVYKTDFEDDTKSNESRFSDLWMSISASEDTLNRLCHPLITTQTTRVPYESLQFEPVITSIREYVIEFENPEEQVDMDTRYELVNKFKEENKQKIAPIIEDITEKNIYFVMELAELYLKSGHHKWAYKLYKKCQDSHFADYHPWLWLRLSETCSALGTKEQEVIDCVNKLSEILDKPDLVPIENKEILCTQGSIISWEYRLLDTAVKLGRMAVDLTEESYGNERSIRLRANLIYFELDLCIDKFPDDISKIEKCLISNEPLINFIIDSRNKEYITANHIDTLSWYQYQKAKIAFKKGDIILANKEIQKASKLINDCMDRWDAEGEDIKRASESTILHLGEINKLKSEIEATRTKVFISYCHRDKKWLERVLIHLKPLVNIGLIDTWSDVKIKASQVWKDEIMNALNSAKIAILIVSADFLASDFIRNEELLPLLDAAETAGVRIITLNVGHSAIKDFDNLNKYQAINDPVMPMMKMEEADQEETLSKLRTVLKDIIEQNEPPAIS